MIMIKPARAVRQSLPVAAAGVIEAPSIASALPTGRSGEIGSEGRAAPCTAIPGRPQGPIAGLPHQGEGAIQERRKGLLKKGAHAASTQRPVLPPAAIKVSLRQGKPLPWAIITARREPACEQNPTHRASPVKADGATHPKADGGHADAGEPIRSRTAVRCGTALIQKNKLARLLSLTVSSPQATLSPAWMIAVPLS